MADTNAVKWLRARGIAFRSLLYRFTEIGAERAAESVERPLEMVCKTLVVRASGSAIWLAIVPGDQRFDPRRMAVAVGARQVELASPAEAERVTGYRVGGITPFALRRKLPVVIEESLLALERIVVNGGRRGLLLELATEDLVSVLEARPTDICRA
jgi:Cys-tRNA(Pro)/Cys-tRNA(Cys) deacylase